jgi:hypothetical protein
MIRIFELFLLFLLAGCAAAPQWSWHKPKATEAEFHSSKYSCLQKAQQPFSSSAAYNSGGIVSPQAISTQSSAAGIATNNDLYEACMYSNGWRKQYTQNSNANNLNAVKMTTKDAQDTCTRLGFKSGTYPFEECVKSRTGSR